MARRLPNAGLWRRRFFDTVADLATELVPSEFAESLGAPTSMNTDLAWNTADALDAVPTTSARSLESSTVVVNAVEERGLLEGVTAADLFPALLARPLGRSEKFASSSRALLAILRSHEFSLTMPWIAKMTYGRGRWNYFVHIPKTAGTHMQALLWCHYRPGSVFRAYPNQALGVSDPWVMAAWLQRLGSDDHPQVWISGHLESSQIRPAVSIWPDDRVVTLVRDPIEQVASAANYFLGLRQSRPEQAESYFRNVMGVHGERDLETLEPSELLALIARNDLSLRPSSYFGGSLAHKVSEEGLICGFQQHVQELLAALVWPGRLELPGAVTAGEVRLNRSSGHIDADALSSHDLAVLMDACQDEIRDYHALQNLAHGGSVAGDPDVIEA